MIRRDRGRVQPPASLGPGNTKIVAEIKKNETLVQSNDAIGAPWKDWSAQLEFKMYCQDEDVKKALSDMFDNKCAYCEGSLDDEDMHTEHFRPKGEVHKDDDPTQRGYWWLGASWENLLPACGHCNRSPGTDHPTGLTYTSGKGYRFPLLPGSPRAISPGEEHLEYPVLVNPAEEEPSDYFTFRHLNGFSFAVINHLPTFKAQLRAMGSMEIYGLNRPGLVRLRTAYLKGVALATRTYIKAAIKLNKAIAQGANQTSISEAEAEADSALDELYKTYLLPSCPYLHAAVRYIENEFWNAKLSLKDLLAGKELYLPSHNLW